MTTIQAHSTGTATDARPGTTRALLAGAVVAGPVFAVVSLTQVFTRPGFDLIRHPLSLLSNGSLGWLQITNFVVTGLLTIAGAVGLRRVLGGTPGGSWAPWLIGVEGAGMVAAGAFRLDPGDGFPAGTPLGQPTSLSWHGFAHLGAGTVSFLALIAACFVLGRHFGRSGARGYAVASRVVGAVFTVGLVWSLAGGKAGALTLAVGAITAMLWVSVVAFRLARD